MRIDPRGWLGALCLSLVACGPYLPPPPRPAPVLPPPPDAPAAPTPPPATAPEAKTASTGDPAQDPAAKTASTDDPARDPEADGPSTGDPARDPEADGPSTGDPASDPEPDRPSTGDPARVEAPQAAPPRPAHRGDVAGNAPYRPEPQAMKTSKKLRLILNDPSGRKAPYDRCDVELCRSIVGLIDGSKKTIDFALYGMRNQTQIFDALMRARKRGVRIRGIVDRTLDGKNYYSSTEKLVAALGTVRDDLESEKRAAREQTDKMDPFAGHKPLCPRPVGFEGPLQCLAYDLGDQCLLAAHASREPLDGSGAIMHDKFFVVDGRFVWTGSTNASDSGTGGYNANLVTVIDAPKVADLFTLEFEQMWARGLYHNYKEPFDGPWSVQLDDQTRVEVLFSPQHKPITRSVRKLIQRAGWKIDIAVFFLTHKGITEDLIKAHRRGVEVRVILDATAAKNGYSKHELLRAAGIPLKIEHWGGKMHMKSAVIDEEVVITGSMNWTSAGEGGNDENTVIIHSVAHGEQYARFFDQLWARIPDKWLEGRPDPESKDSTTACTDGVDNDYDHRADGQDPGCGANPPPLPALPPWRIVAKTTERCMDMHSPDGEEE